MIFVSMRTFWLRINKFLSGKSVIGIIILIEGYRKRAQTCSNVLRTVAYYPDGRLCKFGADKVC